MRLNIQILISGVRVWRLQSIRIDVDGVEQTGSRCTAGGTLVFLTCRSMAVADLAQGAHTVKVQSMMCAWEHPCFLPIVPLAGDVPRNRRHCKHAIWKRVSRPRLHNLCGYPPRLPGPRHPAPGYQVGASAIRFRSAFAAFAITERGELLPHLPLPTPSAARPPLPCRLQRERPSPPHLGPPLPAITPASHPRWHTPLPLAVS